MEKLDVGDLVLCTVDRIIGTVVFVKIDGNGEGSILISEIAPGRIRNLRDYVVPKKRIVCKVLRISGDRIDLSLRRVTQKEKKEVLEQDKQEKSYISILKKILGEQAEKIIEKINKQEKIYDFIEKSRDDSTELENIIGKNESKKLLEIIKTQKHKSIAVKKEFSLSSTKPNGIELIKKTLGEIKNIEIKYISAGKYSMKIEGKDPKIADNQLKEALSEIESSAKKHGLEFSIKEK